MSIGSADIYKAVVASWDAGELDNVFKALWTDPTDTKFEVLCDAEASPGQPFPYCVVEFDPPSTVVNMSGEATGELYAIRDTGFRFNVHAAEVADDSRSAKEIAAYLIEEIIKQFGGHPTLEAEQTLSLDNGVCLLLEYQNDYGVRTGDDVFQWIVSYLLQADVPAMANGL